MTTTLLAIDDSKTMRKVLEITFGGEDYRTVLAANSADALEKVKAENPAVALVDARLGAESGYDLCQSIKSAAPRVAVVILSSKQQPYDRARGMSAGADDFMDKPFDTQQMIDKVATVLRKSAEAPAPAPAARPAPAAAPAPQAAPAVRPATPARTPTAAFGTPATPGPTAAHPAQKPAPAPAATRPQVQPAPMRPRAPTPVAGTPAQQSPAAPPVAARPAPAPAAAPAAAPAPAAAAVAAASGELVDKLQGLGLTQDQVQGVLALSREVIEQVVWEVVPVLAETMIQEEIRRLTSE